MEKLERKMEVKFPHVRKEIFRFVEGLIKEPLPDDQVTSLAAEMLVDFWDLDTDSEKLSGIYILEDEKDEVRDLATALFELVDKHGWKLGSEQYSQFPEWGVVRTAAFRAYQKMKLVPPFTEG